MEELTQRKIEIFIKAVQSFCDSLTVKFENYTEIEIDLIKNGQIQKFEYCIELMWKAIKELLRDKYGIDIASPKYVLKSYFENGNLDYADYETAIAAIDDRNRLSHLYNDEIFNEIYGRLNVYKELLLKIIGSFSIGFEK
ncbi:MAG TPA: HI0074 family nucleotidyltransferase substrate-binding subunit [Spirochaetota bacterium]|nr:HI0074 family nucleotidyltransferase substrate-binding subunit [Spirochaetota bacterium]HOS33454.1 HI0074 family nucleotidyltransferase substrate-binding subunit [Spirochaetota bacterium]HOS56258.1 HI0074 family nucleotidyltransferase substrate-binding subunit [Spirochaetota bacterium]HPK62060.1 HI0074 family nucleotidyltransferase substrate-binding subunit [Spirochaetota bacterium]HQF78665.1 HI0074 family nucleotidyltransferase substrate-binding subunit [Spirochaetota bacterium]